MTRKKIRYVPPVPTISLSKIVARSILTGVIIAIIAIITLILLKEAEIPEKPEPRIVDEFHCKIPELTTLPLLKPKQKLKSCESKGYLTSIASTENFNDSLLLKFVDEDFGKYGVGSNVKSVRCCYRVVNRVPGNDSAVNISDNCEEFHNESLSKDFEISKNIETIFVECSQDGKVFYENAHSIIAHKEKLKKRQIKMKVNATNPYKVVLFGFDGMSQINFKRGMSSIYSLIKNAPGWIEMKGYTRINDESFSNVFAALTGKSPNEKYGKCDPRSNTYLDDCAFIWKDYEKAGYVTTFAEDQADYATFNRHHKGFKSQPTDYYFRPYVLTTEKKLKIRKDDELISCLGWSLYIDHIFMYATKLGQIHVNDPYFGMFYVNSLRNKRMSTAKAMDGRVKIQFTDIAGRDTFAETIVILFGDKGTRFDEYSPGFYEERSPFLYIRLPPKFQKNHPDFVRNMKMNSHRLTTPYDLYITLQHIINLTAKKKVEMSSAGCSNCRSLFHEIQRDRRCSDVNIPDVSCPCSLIKLDTKKDVVKLGSLFAVGQLNRKLTKMKADDGESCAKLKLKKVISASQQLSSPWNMNYIIQFIVSPTNAKFEALLRRKFSTIVSLTPQFEILQEIVHMSEFNGTKLCVSQSNIQLPQSDDPKDLSKRINEDDTSDYSDDLWLEKSNVN